jgi:hypothetical protein
MVHDIIPIKYQTALLLVPVAADMFFKKDLVAASHDQNHSNPFIGLTEDLSLLSQRYKASDSAF